MGLRFCQVLMMAVAICWLSSTAVFAQATGSTGSITGRVTDSSGGILPGVTASVTGPALMGVQTSVTDEGGSYRFPALPPGTYAIRFELQGFATVERTGIQLSINFTATVNAILEVAILEETITVSGQSPVIDTTSTSVQQAFTMQQMADLPNARQMWALIAATPSVTMARTDVGGSEAGTQSEYMAYGYSGQQQIIIEGLNVTYNTGTSTFYPDYGSLEEVSVRTVSHDAQVANPGVQTELLTKSGGNRLSGEVFLDFGNNAMQGSNIPADILAMGVREGSNELISNRNFHASVGGPLKRDRLWWHVAYHNQKSETEEPKFIGPMAGQTFDSHLYNYSLKLTGQVTQNHKLIAYASRNQKEQPLYPVGTLVSDSGQTTNRANDVTPIKVEWNGTLSNKMYAEVRVGNNSLSSANIANSDTTEFYVVDSATGLQTGAERKRQYVPRRKQLDGAVSYFAGGWGGTHNLKFGAGVQWEAKDDGYTQNASGNVRQNMNDGRPINVVLYAPTALRVNRTASDISEGDLTTLDRLTVASAFVADTWSFGRTTLNVSARWDRYHGFSPEQQQIPYSFGPLQVPALTFPRQDYYTWNMIVPRIGLVHDLSGDGSTVIKFNYGRYAFNPGILLGGLANENQLTKSVTYSWSDTFPCVVCIAGDGIYQPGEEGNLLASTLAGTASMDPDLEQPTSTQTTAFIERQLSEGVGARLGFVYYTVRDQIQSYQAFRPPSAYSVPFEVPDQGRSLTYYGIPNSQIDDLSTSTIVMSVPNNGTYKSVEATIAKRRSENWSLSGGVGYTWMDDYPTGYPNTPNHAGAEDRRMYSLKINGTYDLPFGVMFSGVYQLKSGENYARTLAVRAPASCRCTFAGTVPVTSYQEYAKDQVSVLDLRLEKTTHLGAFGSVGVFLDIYNIANAYAAEEISVATGTSFQRPVDILAPRTLKIGFRVSW